MNLLCSLELAILLPQPPFPVWIIILPTHISILMWGRGRAWDVLYYSLLPPPFLFPSSLLPCPLPSCRTPSFAPPSPYILASPSFLLLQSLVILGLQAPATVSAFYVCAVDSNSGHVSLWSLYCPPTIILPSPPHMWPRPISRGQKSTQMSYSLPPPFSSFQGKASRNCCWVAEGLSLRIIIIWVWEGLIKKEPNFDVDT